MILYRLEERLFYEEPIKLEFKEWKVVKETPEGCWIVYDWDGLFINNPIKKWIKKHSLRKFACKTKEEALESYIARRNKQIKILETQLKRAKNGLYIAEEIKKKGLIE